MGIQEAELIYMHAHMCILCCCRTCIQECI